MFRRPRRSEESIAAPADDAAQLQQDIAEEEDADLDEDGELPSDLDEFLAEDAELEAEDAEPAVEDVTVATPVAAAAEPRPEVPATLAQLPEYEGEPPTIIGPATAIEGQVRTPDDLRVEGSVTGVVEVRGTLLIEPGGTVDAEVDARSIRARGRLHGKVHCRDRLDIGEGSHVEGSFTTGILVIEEGAVVSGRFATSGGRMAEDRVTTGAEEARKR
ncbi:MAG TPA: polymer-forming cytoskeletal protein [Dehalococcoidia bacterium]|nr:polymer-forming cytoskeletal protein [Dehalococcoidia bacterium]